MALYSCPECKREISTDAKTCPHCGKNVQLAGAGARWKALPKGAKIFLVACAVIFGLGLAVDKEADKTGPQAPAPAAQAAQAVKPTSSTPPTDGGMTVQPGPWFGFRTREALDKASQLAAQGDKAAWSKFMAQAMASGQIVELKAGETVYVEDTALMSGAAKVRRKGEVNGWWTNMEAVK